MAQVLIISNRLPVSVKKEDGKLSFSASIGGLATGLASYVEDKNNQWIGWPGIPSDELNEADKQEIVEELAKHHCVPVFLSQRQLDDFYSGYSNSVLWPLFHNLSFKKVDENSYKRWWQAYRAVNKQYAEITQSIARADSRIWIHDYQLLLLPELLRRELTSSTIGFFLHIPFPNVKQLGRLPEHKKLLQGVLGADLIGMHTTHYVDDFIENCQASDVGIAGTRQVILPDRAVRVADFPMGIDYRKYAEASKTKEVKQAAARYRKRYKGCKVIAAVDRMDPSKGLVERLKAYRDFLEQNPAQRSNVIFAMIAAPSRSDVKDYQQLAKRLDKLVAEINQTYGTSKWQPVDYMGARPFEEVSALFQIADVAFIAPLKDGMNLAAKEFIASSHKNGVLILSETAGAAEELSQALLVNPRKQASLVAALQESLTMPKAELSKRLGSMQKQLSSNTVQHWAKEFVDALQQPIPGGHRVQSLAGTSRAIFIHDYRHTRKRLLLLDYDGSLVRFREDSDAAKPSHSLLHLLEKLADNERNDVVIVSGRSAEDLEKWLGHLKVSLIAEHGAASKRRGNKHWQTIDRPAARWKRVIRPILESYARQTPGAYVETKDHSLVWHYRASPAYYAQKYGVIIKRTLKPELKRFGVELFQGNKILEIKDPRISKGAAITSWLKRQYDFVLIVGDDFTDEDMFRVAGPDDYTIKVGRGKTAARYRLPASADVKKLLQALTK